MKTENATFYSLYEEYGGLDYEGSTTLLMRRFGFKPASMEDADIIIWNGGADIATEIYGEEPAYKGIPSIMSMRDRKEVDTYNKFKDDKTKLKVGICRGAQLLNCLNGGTLWQDVSHHGRSHNMTVVETGEVIRITSTHHQMMRPNYDKAKLIAVADEADYKQSQRDIYPYGSFPDDHKDTEIVYYPDTHCLCIQGHPEYVPGSYFAEYCIGLINQYLSEVRACAA